MDSFHLLMFMLFHAFVNLHVYARGAANQTPADEAVRPVIASQCEEATFSLTEEDNSEYIYGVESFKYLGSIFDRYDDNWSAVLQNVGKARRV